MKKTTKKLEMLPEYDFSKGVRGKYAKQYKQGTNIVILEKDVAAMFPTTDPVSIAKGQKVRLKGRCVGKKGENVTLWYVKLVK